MVAFLDEIRERHVLQVLAVYIGVAWGVVQFVSFLEERYLLSPHLTDLTLFSVALLLPSVVLITLGARRAGDGRLRRSTVLGVPANLMLAAGVLAFTFSGKSLGAVTTTLSVTDENGDSVERVVPKAAFRKRLAIFDFDAAPADSAGQWLRYAMPTALSVDLTQDMFVNMRCGCVFTEELRKAGFPGGADVPLSLKKKLAREKHLAYFVTGRVASAAGATTLTLSLYETARGRLVQERTYSGADPLALVDQASVQLRRDLQIPPRHIDETADLPVAELTTGSRPALRRMAQGYAALHYGQDWSAAAQHFDAAVALDPNFAFAEFYVAQTYRWLNQSARADAALQSLMGRLFRLSEPYQHAVKTSYYLYRNEPERALATARMRAELAPEDVEAHLALAGLYQMRDEKDAAIASFRRVLELDPAQQEYLSAIGALHERKGDNDGALEYYGRYARAFPNEFRAYLPVGDLSRRLGRHAQARESYQKAMVLEPTNVELTLRLAGLERDNGRFAEAERLMRDALAAARTPADTLQSYAALRSYHAMRGQMREALRYDAARSAAARSQPPLSTLVDQLQTLPLYVRAGETATARARLAAASRQLQPPFDRIYGPLGRIWLHLELGEPDLAEPAVAELEAAIDAMSFETLRPQVVEARGRIEAARGRCAAAVPLLRRKLELEPTDLQTYRHLGRCQGELGQSADAVGSYERLLSAVPFDPRASHELGILYRTFGQPGKADEHLRRAAAVWADADVAFRPAAELRASLAAR